MKESAGIYLVQNRVGEHRFVVSSGGGRHCFLGCVVEGKWVEIRKHHVS
jgi:hypothetical protein